MLRDFAVRKQQALLGTVVKVLGVKAHTSKTKRTAAVSRVPRAWFWQAGLCQELALTSQITASSENEQGSLNQRITVVLPKWESLPGQAENRGWKMLLARALRVGKAGSTVPNG